MSVPEGAWSCSNNDAVGSCDRWCSLYIQQLGMAISSYWKPWHAYRSLSLTEKSVVISILVPALHVSMFVHMCVSRRVCTNSVCASLQHQVCNPLAPMPAVPWKVDAVAFPVFSCKEGLHFTKHALYGKCVYLTIDTCKDCRLATRSPSGQHVFGSRLPASHTVQESESRPICCCYKMSSKMEKFGC